MEQQDGLEKDRLEENNRFRVDGVVYEIINSPEYSREPLWIIIQNEYKEEGADSPEEL